MKTKSNEFMVLDEVELKQTWLMSINSISIASIKKI